ncbi:MAG TPA: PAS domain S-box protein [Candidatus Binatia bacterium]
MLTLITPNFSTMARYAFAILVVILAFLLRLALAPVLGEGVPFILFYPTVALAAWFGGFWPGLLSAVLGGFFAWYVLMPPEFSFALSEPTAVGQLAVFFLFSAFICLLAESLHLATRKAQAGELKEREQREQYRVTLASIGDAVIATDARGRVTFMNAVAESLTGWRDEEAAGKSLAEVCQIINEQTRQPVQNPALRALEQGLVAGLANHSLLISRDGAERAIDDSAAPIRTPGSGITGAVLVFRDVSQRRRAEREIQENRERLRVTLASIGDAVVATDATGCLTYINPVAEKLLGYTSEQATAQPLSTIFNIVNEFTRSAVENPVERVLRDGCVAGLANHTILLRPDGVEVPIDDSAAPINDATGHILGVVLVFRDITERRRAEKTQATLAAIVESSEDAIVSKDLDGRIMTWNVGAERLFGYRQEEVIGKSITLIIPPDRTGEEVIILQRIRNGERVEHYETVRVRKDGSPIDISLTVSPVKSADGTIVGASKIARDITERKKMERQLLEADRQKDNFIAILAHELRNPLSPIRNAVKILEMERPDDHDLLAYCDLIDKEAMQINRLLDDLLDISRITTGKLSFQKEAIDIATAVNAAIETSRPVINEAGHNLTINLPAQPLMVEADPMRLAQVFSNLLNNAAKFTEAGGDIRVDVARQDGQVVVRIKDSGIGMSPELLNKVFDMFVQGETTAARSGLGLGLTLARDIVEFHGGTIEGRSDGPGRGSEFAVTLPLANVGSVAATVAASSDPATTVAPRVQSRTRVVVIDDNKSHTLSLQKLIEAMGHEVRVAYDGASAMKLLVNFVPDFALIDLGLPRINGYDLARWLREQPQFREVTLIAQTGWGREQDRKQARDAGYDHHLVKPIDPQQLAAILSQSGTKRET